MILLTFSYVPDVVIAETIRFEVGVRNANASTSSDEDDHLGVIVTVIAKQPDCRRPNKVKLFLNTFKFLSLSLSDQPRLRTF